MYNQRAHPSMAWSTSSRHRPHRRSRASSSTPSYHFPFTLSNHQFIAQLEVRRQRKIRRSHEVGRQRRILRSHVRSVYDPIVYIGHFNALPIDDVWTAIKLTSPIPGTSVWHHDAPDNADPIGTFQTFTVDAAVGLFVVFLLTATQTDVFFPERCILEHSATCWQTFPSSSE